MPSEPSAVDLLERFGLITEEDLAARHIGQDVDEFGGLAL
jgi:hypothetical protein